MVMSETTPARRVPKALEEAQAMANLRVAGVPIDVIAERYGVSDEKVRQAITTMLARTFDPKTDYNTLRALEVERLEALLRSVWPRAISPTMEVDGKRVANDAHLAYNKRAAEIIEQKARLLGLNAPQVVALIDPDREELRSVVEQLVALNRGVTADEEADILLEEEEDGTYA